MQHTFSEIPNVKVPRSLFKRPFNLKTTIGTDYLYPIYVDEALPGDSFVFRGKFFGRLSTPITPLMDNLYLDTFFFAVPIRLVDDNFRRVMGEREFGDTSSDYVTPVLTTPVGGATVGSLSDYLGIPIGVAGLEFCAYWHRAYNLIWNEWFRDENLCTPVKMAGVAYDGTVTTESYSDYSLLKRGKRHDYFTSCLPWPQKGSPVELSLGDLAPVQGTGESLGLDYMGSGPLLMTGVLRSPASGTSVANLSIGPSYSEAKDIGSSAPGSVTVASQATTFGVTSDPTLSGLIADLSAATPVSINALRQAFAIQSLLELDARGGSRLIELIRAHFGVVSPDARMQRPEYLGGFSQMMDVTSVPQTSATDESSPQGNLSAFVTVSSEAHWIKSFTEHTLIIGLANVRADLSYQQGLPRMFSRRTRYDFYWPALANLGEQAVLNKEIYAQGTSADNEPFGYQERWAEYRYHPNMITGLFRSTAANSLDYWHLAQKFDSLPTLNSTFIEESVPISRVVAVTDEPPVILDAWFDVRCARPMPLYSVPGIGRRL